MNRSLAAYQVALWNRRVPASYRFVNGVPGGFRFLHPTKGFRFISAKRLGISL